MPNTLSLIRSYPRVSDKIPELGTESCEKSSNFTELSISYT